MKKYNRLYKGWANGANVGIRRGCRDISFSSQQSIVFEIQIIAKTQFWLLWDAITEFGRESHTWTASVRVYVTR